MGRHKHYTLYKCMEFSKSKNIIKMIINKNTMAVMKDYGTKVEDTSTSTDVHRGSTSISI